MTSPIARAMTRTRTLVWMIVVGVVVFLLGAYDELFVAFLKEGCRTGDVVSCEHVPFCAARAHATVIVGFATIVVALVLFATRRKVDSPTTPF